MEEIFDAYKGYFIAFGLLLVIVIYFVLFCEYTDNEIYFRKSLKNENYEGIIESKFIDSNNHYNFTILISDGVSEKYVRPFEWITLWDSSNVGDKIVKAKGKNVLFLIKNNFDTSYLYYDRKGKLGIPTYRNKYQ